ncbi:hypothetical protein H4R19_003374 [Coemansia spiralis]|nr:hypothetical protein H4R19_003374 [Coemansia spiralis]
MLVTPNAGVAAASCFDVGGQGKVDASQYSIAIGGNGLDAANIITSALSVEVHPSYDPLQFANNIAVVVFNKIAAEGVTFRVGDLPSEWPAFYFVQRSLNAQQSAWNNYKVVQDTLADATKCSEASRLFAQNQRDFICSTATHQSLYNPSCVLPYKYVVGVGAGGGQTAQLGLYSHSATVGDSAFCGTGVVHNYYVMIANFIPWINSHIGQALTAYHASNAAIATSSTAYQMNTAGLDPAQALNLYSFIDQGQLVRPVLPRVSSGGEASALPSDVVQPAKPAKSEYVTVTTTVTEHYSDTLADSPSVETTTITLSGELTIVDGSVCPTATKCDSASDSDGQSQLLSDSKPTTITVSVSGATKTISVTVTADCSPTNDHSPSGCPSGNNAHESPGSSGMSVSEIVSIVIGSVVAGLVLLAGIGFLVFKRCCAQQPAVDEELDEAPPLQPAYMPPPPFNPNVTDRMQPMYYVPQQQHGAGAPFQRAP